MKFDSKDIFNKDRHPILVAGPCSAESEKQVMEVASALVGRGLSFFRAGVWKPRTRPGCFEGMGEAALPWLQRVKNEFGLPVAVEVATAEHVRLVLDAGIDMLWVGARTTTNPFAVQEIADSLRGADVPVFVKNPVNPDIELWVGALERLGNAGVTRLGAIHRGFSSYAEKCFRNAPQWQIPLELRRRFPDMPILCDPSHIGGKRELVMMLSQQAMDLNFDGLMVETHCNPQCALSDARQQVTPDELSMIMGRLVKRSAIESCDDFLSYRNQIDAIDLQLVELLEKRMSLSREIGMLKKENGHAIYQPARYNEVLEHCVRCCKDKEMNIDAVKGIFELIHSESVRLQLDIVNEKTGNDTIIF